MTSHDPLGITPKTNQAEARRRKGNMGASNHTDHLKIVPDARPRKVSLINKHVKSELPCFTRKMELIK